MAKEMSKEATAKTTTQMEEVPVSATPTHACSACNKLTTLSCPACRYSENDPNNHHHTTWYCSKVCQSKDWPVHKAHCFEVKRVNQLCRASRLAQKVFHLWRKQAFDIPIDRLTTTGTQTRIYQGETGDKVLFPFPEKLDLSREDEEAILDYSSCEIAVGRLHHMFTLAYEGIYKSIEEVRFTLKNPRRQMYLHLSPTYIVNPELSHLVLRVTLKGGKMYAVDISGAQFGFREPVVLWEQFASQRIQQLEATHAFGHAKTLTDNWMATSAAHHIANFWNNKIVSEELIKILDGWLETEKANLAAIMKLKQKAYEEQSSKLLEALNEGVAEFVKAGLSNNNLAVAIDTRYQGICQEISILMGDGTKHRIDVLR